MNPYFESAKPTYIENWPAALCRLSIAQQHVPLTLDEARSLGSSIAEFGEAFFVKTPEQEEQCRLAAISAHCRIAAKMTGKEPPPVVEFPKLVWTDERVAEIRRQVDGIRERVASALGMFPFGGVIRLGSRSPKDSWAWNRSGPKIYAGDGDPLRFILDCSERMVEDLTLALQNDYPPHIFVRQYVEIPAWAEFRCFMRGRKLVGVSQYQYRDRFEEIHKEQSIVRWAIHLFFEQLFRPASHLDDVVFDVFVSLKRRGNDAGIEVKLLEINPFTAMTDPCLFDWRGRQRPSGSSSAWLTDDFDGTFRYAKENGEICKLEIQ